MESESKKTEETVQKDESINNDNSGKLTRKDKIDIAKNTVTGVGNFALSFFDKKNAHEENMRKIEADRQTRELEIKQRSLEKELEFYKKMYEEMKEQTKKKENEEEDKKNKLKEGADAWNQKENKLIEKFFDEIDLDYIKKILENDNLDIMGESDFNHEFNQIFKEELKNNEIVHEKHNSIFQSIKDNINGIQSLNFMVAGFTGVGKSALTNAILDFNEADEGGNIDPQTGAIKLYSNPNVPGIKIYDTIGVEATSIDNNISQIKKGIENTFDKNLQDPEKSLHGILYCIKNGNTDTRIEEGEIKFIKELNKLYGDGDILIIVFTQSYNQNTETRKKQLKEKLNNPNIEIIEVIAKDFYVDENYTIKKKGLDELIEAMENKCKGQLIKCNIKQIAKKNIKEQFYKEIKTDSEHIKRKIKEYELENTFDEECKYIINSLIGNLALDFDCLNYLVSKTIENSKKVMKNKLIEENKEKWEIKLHKEFRIINNNYDKQLDDSSITDDLMDKYYDFFTTKIEDYIKKIIIEKASLMFIEKVKNFFGEIISENIKDEEIQDIVNNTIHNIMKKRKKKNNDQQGQ